MNSQDIRNLQEAYFDVAMGEGKVPWDDPNRPLQSGHTPAEKNRAKRARTGVEDPNKFQMDISDKDMARYGGMKTADDTETFKAPKQKKTLLGKKKPLEHETPPHEFKKNRRVYPNQTGNEYSMNQSAGIGGGNATIGQARRYVGRKFPAGRSDGDSSIFPTPIKQGDSRRRTSKKWGGPNPKTLNNSYDLYDIILSHLLDEGYADTEDSALVIMANMSEDWRESICEDYKPWDFGPKQKAKRKYDQLVKDKAAGNSPPGTATRANKIASVAKDMRTTLDKNSASTGTNPAKQGLQPATRRHTAAALRGAGGGMTASKTYDVKPLNRR